MPLLIGERARGDGGRQVDAIGPGDGFRAIRLASVTPVPGRIGYPQHLAYKVLDPESDKNVVLPSRMARWRAVISSTRTGGRGLGGCEMANFTAWVMAEMAAADVLETWSGR